MSLLRSLASDLPPPESRSALQIDDEICEELAFHIEMRTLDNLQAGMPADEARADALRRFGDWEAVRRDCRRVFLGERIMLHRVHTALTLLLLAAVIGLGTMLYRNQRATEVALDRMLHTMEKAAADAKPPIVVATTPANDCRDVDPSLKEIRVTYSKPMMDRSWSWTQASEDTFPQTTGAPHYLDDRRTCVLPVELQPGKEYVLWLNSAQFHNFKDADGQPAVAQPLCFRTRELPSAEN